MTEKKRPIKPGQVNLSEYEPELLGPEPTSASGGKTVLGVPPSSLSRRTSSTTSSTVVWKVTSVKLPATVLFQAKKRCLELGLHLQDVFTVLLERWLGTEILTPEHRKNPPKGSLRPQLEEREIHQLLDELDNSRRRGAKPDYTQYLLERLTKAAKKVKLTAELEEQVRKELKII